MTLRNPSATEAVDLSGWRLQGAGTATLPPGTAIPAGGEVVVPADAVASAGTRLPGTFVAGQLDAGLDDAGGLLEVVDAVGATRGSAVLADLVPTAPPAPTGLRIEASADQVETIAAKGAGVGLTVAVTNHGPSARTGVTLTSAGTTCGRSLGTLAAGASTVVRCATVAGTSLDRTYRFRATTGATTVASNRVEVRTLRHQTSYWSTTLPDAPAIGTVSLGGGNTIHAPVTLAPPTASAGPDTPPVRWTVATALEPGRAIPTQGAVVPPGAVATIAFTEGVPVRLAFAARNGAGTGARSPLTPFLTPRPTTSWPYASSAEQVTGIFQLVDGREPTPEEVAAGAARLDAGASPADLIEERLGLGRWPTQVEPLIRLYAAYFGRPPDAAGLRYWLAQRAAGRTLDRISSTFAASAEFERTTGSLDDAAFVRFVYAKVLGRTPDASGLSYWVKRLGTGWSRGRVMTAFSESGEGKAKLLPQVGPTLVSTALLGRPPSAAEARPGTDWLRAGGSLDTVIDGVRSSDAFADHVG